MDGCSREDPGADFPGAGRLARRASRGSRFRIGKGPADNSLGSRDLVVAVRETTLRQRRCHGDPFPFAIGRVRAARAARPFVGAAGSGPAHPTGLGRVDLAFGDLADRAAVLLDNARRTTTSGRGPAEKRISGDAPMSCAPACAHPKLRACHSTHGFKDPHSSRRDMIDARCAHGSIDRRCSTCRCRGKILRKERVDLTQIVRDAATTTGVHWSSGRDGSDSTRSIVVSHGDPCGWRSRPEHFAQCQQVHRSSGTVSLTMTSIGRKHCFIVIRDTGIGMDKKSWRGSSTPLLRPTAVSTAAGGPDWDWRSQGIGGIATARCKLLAGPGTGLNQHSPAFEG